MTEVLSDASTYKKVDKNPIKQITTKINQLVKSWHDNDIIDYQIFKQLYSLFTNIPNELVYESVRKRWHYISQNTELSLSQFLHAIELILHSTSFCFDGQFYEQIYGSPMGSPLSPILADMVMKDLETHCLSLLDFDVRIYLRYVDDVFTIVPKRAINALLEAFNGYHPRLRFTYEIETDDSLPFLDTIMIRDDERFHHANINIIKDILVNSFPIKLVNKHINNRLRQLENRRDLSANNSERDSTFDVRRCVVIPYVKGLSAGIRDTLERVRCDVVYKIPKKLSAVIRKSKDRLATNKETNVVYKIDCENCDASYIGQTKRHLETRLKEHFSDIKKHDSNFSV
ncbi:uncharacterized protein LOC112466975, partial [Temnothorax curvispinosus]|uniref:Uncharacterized protein LOC112466975 n=1 Tax=Temnothorax curvispinosus TaxID=300111 RepID=A0A6J1RA85_9HYME